MADRVLYKDIAKFVQFHLADRHVFAPFTGTDHSAWKAFLYGLELWGRSQTRVAVEVLRACLMAAQPRDDIQAIFQKSIPGVLDWGYEERLWTEINDIGASGPVSFPAMIGPRVCAHIHSKRHKTHAGWFVCKDSTCRAEWRPDSAEERSHG